MSPRSQSPPAPFGERIRGLRRERGWSQETLAYEVRRRHQSSPTAGAIGQFERGVTRPTAQTIAGIAAAFGIEPGEFPEYRLALTRRAFDEAALGLEAALANLGAFEDVFAAPAKSDARLRRRSSRRGRSGRS